MNQHYGSGLGLKRQLHDFSWVHARTVNRAAKELDETQKPVMGSMCSAGGTWRADAAL
jgi:hypothetical protein